MLGASQFILALSLNTIIFREVVPLKSSDFGRLVPAVIRWSHYLTYCSHSPDMRMRASICDTGISYSTLCTLHPACLHLLVCTRPSPISVIHYMLPLSLLTGKVVTNPGGASPHVTVYPHRSPPRPWPIRVNPVEAGGCHPQPPEVRAGPRRGDHPQGLQH